jgi:hypothetical protein
MNDTLQVVLVVLAAVIAARILLIFALAGGDMRRIRLAIRGSWRTLRNVAFADQVEKLLAPPPPPETKPPRPSGVPLRFLALLQREGRLLDFLLENIQAYPNEQIGAAVRDIHRHCHEALQEHLVLEPVIDKPEESSVEVPVGFDPSAIRLTGNVTGSPPFRGALKHHGWQVREIKLAPPPKGQDELVLQPAEVELP